MPSSDLPLPEHLRLFEATGIELEYMIVDRATLDVRPITDELIRAACGEILSELDRGDVSWSNELVLHVVELKTNGPTPSLLGVADRFQAELRVANALLEPLGARLMPTAMHPWMDPDREMRLWPHEYSPVYETFDRIFDCRGHGWSNLQSMHVNLPFADDDEFARLHAAIRFLLPLMPALSASSPVVAGAPTGAQDNRMRFYRQNARRVPSVAGAVVPEVMRSRAEYEGVLLEGIYRDLAPLDPIGVLRYEFVNARGAIARFDRYAIEIRVLDVQEHPRADLAIAALIRAVLVELARGRWAPIAALNGFGTDALAAQLWRCVDDSGEAQVDSRAWLECVGYDAPGTPTAAAVWRHLRDAVWPPDAPERAEFDLALDTILERGTLSRRILAAAGPAPTRARLREVYGALCDCLDEGRAFEHA